MKSVMEGVTAWVFGIWLRDVNCYYSLCEHQLRCVESRVFQMEELERERNHRRGRKPEVTAAGCFSSSTSRTNV
jgi:hypothetical protein